MTELGKQKSTVKPQEVEILETKVFVASNIKAVSETIGEVTFEGFEFDLVEYGKDEYIRLQAELNCRLEKELTGTQEALCDVFELLN